MKSMTLLLAPLIFGSVLCFYPSVATAQTTSGTRSSSPDDDRQVLKALLEEMRQLRLALQHTQAVSQRIQVTLERLRLQQDRVDSIRDLLDTTRARLNELRNVKPQLEERVKTADETLAQTVDQSKRTELELQIKELKAGIGRLSREEEQKRQADSDLSAELQSAQAKLNELQNQLDGMMRQLEAP